MKTSFNKFDSHRQNSIDSFELLSCMAYLGMEIDVVDAEDMIAEVDSDGDSKLTFAEFRDVLHAAAKKEHFWFGESGRLFLLSSSHCFSVIFLASHSFAFVLSLFVDFFRSFSFFLSFFSVLSVYTLAGPPNA